MGYRMIFVEESQELMRWILGIGAIWLLLAILVAIVKVWGDRK